MLNVKTQTLESANVKMTIRTEDHAPHNAHTAEEAHFTIVFFSKTPSEKAGPLCILYYLFSSIYFY